MLNVGSVRLEGDECLDLEITPLTFRRQRRGLAYWSASVAAPESCDESSVDVKVCSKSATALSARAKSSGSSFPRFAARRRIPLQANGLK